MVMNYKNYVQAIRYVSPWNKEAVNLICEYNVYVHGGIALSLLREEEGFMELYATASVCVPDLANDEIAIKNYGENEGMLEQLLDNGVIYPPHRYTHSGYVVIPVCKLKEHILA